MNSLARLPLLVAALLALPAHALAQAEPVHVAAHASFATVQQGGFQDVDCLVGNQSGERVLVHFTTFVTYADGTVQAFRINQPPTEIGPDEAFILSIGFAVPRDAAPGTATFTCSVRVLGPAGAGFTEADAATFEVAAA